VSDEEEGREGGRPECGDMSRCKIHHLEEKEGRRVREAQRREVPSLT
jgi:hypothetical protein